MMIKGGVYNDRRPSYTHEDMFHGFILGMDSFALGLLKAAKIIEDGRIDGLIADRYASFNTTPGVYLSHNEKPRNFIFLFTSLGK